MRKQFYSTGMVFVNLPDRRFVSEKQYIGFGLTTVSF